MPHPGHGSPVTARHRHVDSFVKYPNASTLAAARWQATAGQGGNRIVVRMGAFRDDVGANHSQGSAYMFDVASAVLSQTQLVASDGVLAMPSDPERAIGGPTSSAYAGRLTTGAEAVYSDDR